MKKQLVTIKDFKGYYDWPDSRIPEEGFVTAGNCYVTNQGSIVARQGFQYFGSLTYTDAAIIDVWYLLDGTIYLVIDLFNQTTTKFVNITTAAESFSKAVRTDLVLQHNNLVYLFRDGAAFSTMSSAGTLTTMAFTVEATVGIVHKSRMFVCDNLDSAIEATVKFSDLFTINAPNTAGGWPANNFVDVQSSDSDAITAMTVLNDTLIIFKSLSTWALYTEGEPPWTLRQLHPSIGCIGRNTPVVIGGMVYFVSNQGVIRTDGTSFENISPHIENPIVRNTPGTMNDYSAVEYRGKYIHTVPQNFEVYNIEKDVWTTWNVTGETFIGRLVKFINSNTEECLVNWDFDTSSRGFILVEENVETGIWQDRATDDYTVTLHGKLTDFETPNKIKNVKQVILTFSSKLTSPITVSVSYFRDDDASTLGPYTGILPASADVTRTDIVVKGPMKCYENQLKIEIPITGYVELLSISYDVVVDE